MKIKKIIQLILVLLFNINLYSCYAMNTSYKQIDKKSVVHELCKAGKLLDKKLDEFLKKYEKIKDIKIKDFNKKSIIFNHDMFEYLNKLKNINENIRTALNYKSEFFNESIKNNIMDFLTDVRKRIIQDEYIRKLYTINILNNEYKYSNLDQFKKPKIDDLINKRMKYIILNFKFDQTKYSDVIKFYIVNKYITKEKFENISTEKFNDIMMNINTTYEERLVKENDINYSKSEIEKIFNAKKPESDRNIGDFLSDFMDDTSDNAKAFLFIYNYSIISLIDNRIDELVDDTFNELYIYLQGHNFDRLTYEVKNIIDNDKKRSEELIKEIEDANSTNTNDKIQLNDIYIDKEWFSRDYIDNIADIFENCHFAQEKYLGTDTYTYKTITSLFNKLCIRINPNNTHLSAHFKPKNYIESMVKKDKESTFSGKFDVSKSIFNSAHKIDDLKKISITNKILIVSAYNNTNKDSEAVTNYIVLIYDYNTHKFVKTGEVYSKRDNKWYDAYAVMLVVADKDKSLITLHPRHI